MGRECSILAHCVSCIPPLPPWPQDCRLNVAEGESSQAEGESSQAEGATPWSPGPPLRTGFCSLGKTTPESSGGLGSDVRWLPLRMPGWWIGSGMGVGGPTRRERKFSPGSKPPFPRRHPGLVPLGLNAGPGAITASQTKWDSGASHTQILIPSSSFPQVPPIHSGLGRVGKCSLHT